MRKILQLLLITAVSTNAVTTLPSYAKSVASVAEDITNSPVTGIDDSQSKVSEYETFDTKIANNQAEVYATHDASYNIQIPKTIILSGAAGGVNTGEYTVSVTGDLAGKQTITVEPQTNTTSVNGNGPTLDDTKKQFYLGQVGKDDIVATVEQSKTVWDWNDALDVDASKTTGTVTTKDMSAGSWVGNFNFVVMIDSQDVGAQYGTNSYTIDYGFSLNGIELVAISPTGKKHVGVIELNGTSVTFENLNPGSEYVISVISGSGNFTSDLKTFTTSTVDGANEVAVIPQLSDWEYKITEYESTPVVMLTKYLGSDVNIIIPSTFTVNDVEYPTVFAKSGYTGTYKDSNGHIVPTGTYGTFINNKDIQTVTFENGCRIENNDMNAMFYGCSSLTSVTNIPQGITSMEWTFASCSSLVIAPTIPNTVTSLFGAFRWATSLSDISGVVVTDACTSLRVTFAECESLTSESLLNFYIPEGKVTMWGTFKDCTSLTDITGFVIKSSVTDIRSLFQGSKNITGTITIDCTPKYYDYAFDKVKSKITLDYTANCTNVSKIVSANSSSAKKGQLVALD